MYNKHPQPPAIHFLYQPPTPTELSTYTSTAVQTIPTNRSLTWQQGAVLLLVILMLNFITIGVLSTICTINRFIDACTKRRKTGESFARIRMGRQIEEIRDCFLRMGDKQDRQATKEWFLREVRHIDVGMGWEGKGAGIQEMKGE
ncbi:hypothetical protein WAI453_006819 [Rhynchosporium graminicola]